MSQSTFPSSSSASARNGSSPPRLVDSPPARVPRSVYDALTDLFLGDGVLAPEANDALLPGSADDHSTLTKPASGPGDARLEAVVLVDSSALASAWLLQYARHIAETQDRAVAVLRVRSGTTTLETVGVRGPAPVRAFDSLDQAILGALHAGVWIVNSDGEIGYGQLLDERLIDGITLLSGADEPAIVACYRALKSLVHRQGARADVPHDDGSIRLAVLGSTAEKARDAADRLEHAAETFLGRVRGRAMCISKIGGANVATLYRGADARPIDELIDLIRALGSEVKQLKSNESVDVRGPGVAGPAATIDDRAAHTAGEPPTRELASAGSTCVHLPGLTGVPHRCPFTPGVELGVDQAGVLHLLVRCGESVASAVMQLVAATSWAKLNSALLCAACPAIDRDRIAAPLMHVFTQHPKDVRTLLDSEIRLHLLVRATSGASDVWVCKDLN